MNGLRTCMDHTLNTTMKDKLDGQNSQNWTALQMTISYQLAYIKSIHTNIILFIRAFDF